MAELMIQEYLFVNGDNKEDILQYNPPKDVKRSIQTAMNGNSWIVSFSSEGDSLPSAKALSTLDDYIISTYHPIIIRDDCSAFYNKKLFPVVNSFERKLRRMIYMKICVADYKDSKSEFSKLDEKTFDEIFVSLFRDEKFCTDLYEKMSNKSKDRVHKFSKFDIADWIEEISFNPPFVTLFGNSSLKLFVENRNKVKDIRNAVMHAHHMSTRYYEESKKLLENVICEIDMEIDALYGYYEKSISNSVVENETNTSIQDAIARLTEENTASNVSNQLPVFLQDYSSAYMPDIIEINKQLFKTIQEVQQSFQDQRSELSEFIKKFQESWKNRSLCETPLEAMAQLSDKKY